MNTPTRITPSLRRGLVFAGLAAFAVVAALPTVPVAHAQSAAQTPMSLETAARLHLDGLALEKRRDDSGAFAAFLASAQSGYPPAQRRLGEIYDHGNPAVERNYEQSIHWYERAYNGGEDIPWLGSRMPGLNYGP